MIVAVISALAPNSAARPADHHAEAVVLAEAIEEVDEPELAAANVISNDELRSSRDECIASHAGYGRRRYSSWRRMLSVHRLVE